MITYTLLGLAFGFIVGTVITFRMFKIILKKQDMEIFVSEDDRFGDLRIRRINNRPVDKETHSKRFK